MAYLEWSRAFTGRVRRDHLGAHMSRAPELAARLASELDQGLLPFLKMGYVEPLRRDLPGLIEAGIDVLNPVQPECMDFREIHERYGDRLSFHGTVGTQSVMPFGTPEDVRRTVFENLDIAGPDGGLYVCPTHLLEPEVPVENVIAYIEACRDYCAR